MLVTSALTLAVGASLAVTVSRYPDRLRQAMHIWIGGLLLQIPVFLLFGLIGALPGVAAVVAANTLFAFAYAEMGRAVRVFAGGDPRTTRLEIALIVALILIPIVFGYIWPDPRLRLVLGAPVLAWLSIERRALDPRPRRTAACAGLSHRRPLHRQRDPDAAARAGRDQPFARDRAVARVQPQPVFPDRIGIADDRHDRISPDVQRPHQRGAFAARDARSADRRVQPAHVRGARAARHRRSRARARIRCRCSPSTSITSSSSTTNSATPAAMKRCVSSSR